MKVLKAIQVEDTVWDEFIKIADKEGRVRGKVLEMLIDTYNKQQEDIDGKTINGGSIEQVQHQSRQK